MSGKLELDGRLLRFTPDEISAEQRPESVQIVDIKRIDRTWSKLLGVVPVAPNGMDVVMRNGQRYAFTVAGRKEWIQELSYAQADTPKG